MARDDRLKKAQAAGADFIETARVKAEEFLKELARTGGETQGAFDDLVAGGRKTGEQLVATITKEIRNQVNSLGLVTRIDLQALEARLTRRATAAKSSTAKSAAPKATAAKSTAAKATGPAKSAASAASKSAAPRKAAASKAAPRKAAPRKAAATKAAPAKKAAASTKKAATSAVKATGSTKKAAAKKTTKKAAG